MGKVWVTFLLENFDEIKGIKKRLDELEYEIITYTEGELPVRHLSVLFNVLEEEEDRLKDKCDDILLDFSSIGCIVWGEDVMGYYEWYREEFGG